MKEAKKLAAKLALVIFFSENYESELENFIEVSKGMENEIESVLVLQVRHMPTPTALLKTVYPAIKAISPGIKVGYGTDRFFADINRNLPQHPDYDFIGFRLNPQTHLTDTRTLLENLNAQRDIPETLVHHIGNGKEIHIFISFKTGVANHEADNIVPLDYDERLHSSFGAAWTLLTIQNYSAAHLSLYDTVGYKGVVSDEHITSNNPSAIYKVLTEIKAFKPVWILPSRFPDIPEMILENANGDQLIFNFDSRYFRYAIEGL
jgi:hypothetical protein